MSNYGAFSNFKRTPSEYDVLLTRKLCTDGETGKGYLIIEDKNRNTRKLEGREVAQLFGVNPPRLVILTACESSPLIPFLLSRKVPAVMAMQYTVLVKVAHQFVERFYSLLVRGSSVLQAVSAARSAVFLNEGIGCTGWFTPVLYARSDSILAIDSESPVVVCEKEAVKRADMVTDLLGVENFVGRRKDLWLVEKAFFEDNLKMAVITGIGGIGKTALASKFVKSTNIGLKLSLPGKWQTSEWEWKNF